MNRRRFLTSAAGAVIGAGGVALPNAARARTVHGARSLENWAWVHGDRERSRAEWRRSIARARDAGIHGVLVGGDDIGPAADAAHELGLAADQWIWILNRTGDRWVKEHHPEWFTISRNGESSLESPPYVGYYQWVCPTRQPVREYLKNVVARVARDSAVDGVHLDYIRLPDVILPVGLWSTYDLVQDREYPEFDFCYCEVCREAFHGLTGRDPMELSDAPNDIGWREFRWNAVTRLVTELAETVHAHGKRISAAVFPTPAIARRLVRQAWDAWPLDRFFPMQYHNFYNEDLAWIGAATRAGLAALPRQTPLYSGLYLPALSPADLGAAVGIVRAAGGAGVSLFELAGLTDEHAAALRAAASG